MRSSTVSAKRRLLKTLVQTPDGEIRLPSGIYVVHHIRGSPDSNVLAIS